jgi:hypothetical protein
MVRIEQIPKTALDVFRMLPEGTLCEVIDNVLYMSPPRTYKHQKLLGFLALTIANYLEKTNTAELIISPFRCLSRTPSIGCSTRLTGFNERQQTYS